MATMKDAMKRLEVIHQACAPQDNPTENPGLDEFCRVKKQLSQNVKDVRLLIKERDDLLKADKASKKGVGSGTETAEMSFKIRSMLKGIKDDIQTMDSLVKKAEKKIKGKNKPDLQEIIDSRKEIVKLCYQHLEECENLDKARFNDKMAGDRVNLFSGGGVSPSSGPSRLDFNKFKAGGPGAPGAPGGFGGPGGMNGGSGGGGGGGMGQELPDIEVQEDLALIRQRNMDIDQELDEIAAGVQVVKQIAIQMGEEVEKQNDMLTEIETKVDHAHEHVQLVNMRMKEALDGVMKGDKFLVNCVLICILLGLVAYIASQLV